MDACQEGIDKFIRVFGERIEFTWCKETEELLIAIFGIYNIAFFEMKLDLYSWTTDIRAGSLWRDHNHPLCPPQF
jgi:hypothetical protein